MLQRKLLKNFCNNFLKRGLEKLKDDLRKLLQGLSKLK